MTRPSTGSGSTPATPRFLRLTDVAEVLAISDAQAYALVRSGELPAIKVGGRGQWRVETTELETYISRQYAETREFIATHPFGSAKDEPDRPADLDDLDEDLDDDLDDDPADLGYLGDFRLTSGDDTATA